MYEVILMGQAERFYAAAQRPLARKLARCFEHLEQDPRRHSNAKPLTGPLAGYHRFRVGDYRVVYRIDEPARKVLVVKIAHRREVYQ